MSVTRLFLFTRIETRSRWSKSWRSVGLLLHDEAITSNNVTVKAGNRSPWRDAYWEGTFAWVGAGAWDIKCGDGAVGCANEAVIHARGIKVVSGNRSTRIDCSRFGTCSPRHIEGCEGTIVVAHKAVLDPNRVNEETGYCTAWVNTKCVSAIDCIRRVKGDVSSKFSSAVLIAFGKKKAESL